MAHSYGHVEVDASEPLMGDGEFLKLRGDWASIPTTGNIQLDSRNVLSSTQVVLEFTTCY
jgi:hypothetical protein